MAEKILPITRRANVGLVINDHLDIARDIGAEFCHLGQEDFFDAGFTSMFPNSKLQTSELQIGLSTHAPEQAQRALTPARITSPSGRFTPPAPSRPPNP